MKRCLAFSYLFSFALAAFGQEPPPLPITILNPSFEDLPEAGKVPVCWANCGFEGETPPDILPNAAFGVFALPRHGTTYLGMVTRDDNTWEAIGQKLVKPLKAGQCYSLTFYAARSEDYRSLSRISQLPANFNRPVKLRIWAGDNLCALRQLLAETPPVNHLDWRPYTIDFKAKQAYEYLLLEVHYARNDDLVYGGNVLLDEFSPLTPVACDDSLTAFPETTFEYRITGKVNDRALNFFYYPKPQYWENFETVLPRYSREIFFDGNFQLEKGHYYNRDKQLVLQNPYLDHLIRLFKKVKNRQLIIAVPGNSETEEMLKIEDLNAALRFFEAPMDRVMVQPFSKSDQQARWMGTRDGVLMRVEE